MAHNVLIRQPRVVALLIPSKHRIVLPFKSKKKKTLPGKQLLEIQRTHRISFTYRKKCRNIHSYVIFCFARGPRHMIWKRISFLLNMHSMSLSIPSYDPLSLKTSYVVFHQPLFILFLISSFIIFLIMQFRLNMYPNTFKT